MPSVEKLPSGRWSALYRDSARKQRRVPGTFARKTDAREAAQEAQVKARRRAAAEKGVLSARTAWGDWWEIVADRHRGDSETDLVEASIARNHLLPRWREVALNQVSSRDLNLWVGELAHRYQPSFVHRVYGLFRHTITLAVQREVLTASPCVGVKLPKITARPKRYVTVETAKSITPSIPAEFADAVNLIMETGLRPNELAGLHTHRVDLTARVLTVAETYVHYKKIMRPWPKDRESRQIPLTETAVAILERRLALATRADCGRPHSDGRTCRHDLVFRGPRGGIVDARGLAEMFRRRDADATPYALRRGFATRAADGGLDAFELARIMGHADIKETQGYVQQTPAARGRFLAALGEHPELRQVPNVERRGADRGADSDRDTPGSTGIDSAGKEA
ncbi:MAG: tyrosine-type recombinase/integrase [Sciscionella sp.]